MFTEEEARTDEPAANLPPEDDFGNTEYKLLLCGLTRNKLYHRTTQMRFRLTVSKLARGIFSANNVI